MVIGEPNIYHDSGVFYKNRRFYLEVCLTCEELVGVLTGDDGVGFMGFISVILHSHT